MTKQELQALREKMAKLATEARTELDKLTPDTEEGPAKEIQAKFDTMMADYDSLDAVAQREEQLLALETRSRSPLTMETIVGDDPALLEEPEARTLEYAEVFSTAVRFGVGALDAEERAMLQANLDRGQELRAQAAGTDSAGGYTVPEGFSGEIDKALAAWGPMWDANVVRELNTTSGNALPWPTVDDTSNRGRLKAENAAVDDDGSDDATFGERVLNAYVYDTGMVRIPIELLQDSAFNMEALLDDLFSERLGRTANQVLTTGTGTGQPNGIVTASTVGVTSASPTAITGDEVIDLLHSVDPAYRMSPRCRFMFNDNTMAAIRKLKDGQGNYLWQLGDVRSGEPSMILGKPYSVNQAMDDIGAGNRSMIFGDLSRYVVRKVNGFSVITLRERYAENFQIGMVGFKRFDGELINTAAVKALTG